MKPADRISSPTLSALLSSPLSAALLALAFAAPFAAPAAAQTEVLPTGYVFDQPTACGLFCYHDGATPTSVAGELIDGRYGFAGWAANGNADPWVGWLNRPAVTIDFGFAAPTAIDSIRIGSTQNRLDDVVLPSIDVYAWNGSAWTFVQGLATPEDAANNQPIDSTAPHGFLTLSGLAINASAVRIVARQSLDGPWTFIDEVDFFAAAVPEPAGATLALAGLAVVGWAARRRLRGR